MTILKCDRCGRQVEEFKISGAANFPEDYREVCESCWQIVDDAQNKATGIAEEARTVTFAKEFNKLVTEVK